MTGKIIYSRSLFRGDDWGSDDQSNRTNPPICIPPANTGCFSAKQNAVHIGDLVAGTTFTARKGTWGLQIVDQSRVLSIR